MNTELVKKFAQMIESSDQIVFFGGAGVSTESGVPDFRSKDGLYNQHDIRFDSYSPEYLLSHSCLRDHPEVVVEFYRQKSDARHVAPNPAHYFLAALERMGKLSAVVTQNIDGLHQKAGSKKVYEIHGTTMDNYCTRCGKHYPADYIYESKEAVPHCDCGGIIRCNVTLYEEGLPERAVSGAIMSIRHADMLIIGGTSLSVYPAASFIDYYGGYKLAVINREPLGLRMHSGELLEVNEPIGAFFAAAAEEMGLKL